jgi:hypothetical protein
MKNGNQAFFLKKIHMSIIFSFSTNFTSLKDFTSILIVSIRLKNVLKPTLESLSQFLLTNWGNNKIKQGETTKT